MIPRQAVERELSTAERKKMGKLARENCPIELHSAINISSRGKRDVIEIIEKSNDGRIKELVPIRYARMMQSPFTFFRGSAALMAADLAQTPSMGQFVQACGDCHVQNFGAFATPERNIVVDINDFDETLPAPWEWDVKRLAASYVLAAIDNNFGEDFGKDAAYRMAQSYREYMNELSKMSILDVWYSHIKQDDLMDQVSVGTAKRAKKIREEAIRKSTPEVMMEKFTTSADGHLRFKEIPPLLCHMDGITAGAAEKEAFDRFEMVDIARKVVGIGSVGTLCGVILMVSSENDVLVLQIKEARKSVLEPYAGASQYPHHGQRVVQGQRLMQAASDMFLGWVTGIRKPFRHFFIRQLRDVKIGANTELWTKGDFKVMAKTMGQILARAHARSGYPSVLQGYLGKDDAFENAIAGYALAYAAQTARDHMVFQKACQSGKLPVQDLG
jgi:uncharacterized protein (DUF2252 family)